MSDPVTNVEIEDVLSSIRRLVSDGDKARGAASVPADPYDDDATQGEDPSSGSWFSAGQDGDQPVAAREDGAVDAPQVKPDRLVLTPAFLVNDNAAPRQDDTPQEAAGPDEDASDGPDETGSTEDTNDHGDGDWPDMASADPVEDAHEGADPAQMPIAEEDDHDGDAPDESGHDESGHDDNAPDDAEHDDAGHDDNAPDDAEDLAASDTAQDQAVDEGPLELTNMVFDAPPSEAAAPSSQTGSDRSELVATIAELEAAISKGSQDFEPDGSEVMGQTIAWPGTIARQFTDAEEAEIAESDADDQADAEEMTAAASEGQDAEDPHQTASPAPHDDVATDQDDHHEASAEGADFEDDDLDDDLDEFLETGPTALDEEALRALVSQVVREELTGPMGERITRNVRKLVRREIYRILSSQEFD